MKPTKIITLFIKTHGEDIVTPNYIKPKNVRILSVAGTTGCYNWTNLMYEQDIASKFLSPGKKTEDITTYRFLQNTRELLLQFERDYDMYDNLDESFRETETSRSRFIPDSGMSRSQLTARRTTKGIYAQTRIRLIKSTIEHKYFITPKGESESGIDDGIYVIDTRNNPDSGLEFGDNFAELRFDINETSQYTTTISSIHDINDILLNMVRRHFGKYLGVASMYIAVADIEPFTSEQDVLQWIETNYRSKIDNIYKFGCMKLFRETDPRILKALMCARFLGEKFEERHKKDQKTNELDVFSAILNQVNKLTPAQYSKFQTGLSPTEYDKLLRAYNVSYNPTYVGKTWESIRDEVIETFNSIPVSNQMKEIHKSVENCEFIDEVYLSKLITYLKGLGYDGINIIDFSCRVNTDYTEEEMDEQTKKERLSLSNPTSPISWGGTIKNRKRKRRISTKKKFTRKQNRRNK